MNTNFFITQQLFDEIQTSYFCETTINDIIEQWNSSTVKTLNGMVFVDSFVTGPRTLNSHDTESRYQRKIILLLASINEPI